MTNNKPINPYEASQTPPSVQSRLRLSYVLVPLLLVFSIVSGSSYYAYRVRLAAEFARAEAVRAQEAAFEAELRARAGSQE